MKRVFTGAVSSYFGRFASKKFNPTLQKFINRSYVKIMGLEMDEFKSPDEYKSLNRLFTRQLLKERKVPKDKNSVISPSDSLITQIGKIEKSVSYQIKGMEYSIKELLGENYIDEVQKLDGGDYINLYLSPKDYHRYHSPFDIEVESVTHIPGKLYPVNIPFLKKKRNLFIENERVIISVKDINKKRHFIVLVGALNVGKMVVTFEEKIITNSDIEKPKYYSYNPTVPLKKGELFGWFEMGSTILILSEKNSINYMVSENERVKFSQKIGSLA
jgi:phosphatidylserine decarboxylase